MAPDGPEALTVVMTTPFAIGFALLVTAFIGHAYMDRPEENSDNTVTTLSDSLLYKATQDG